jgi:Tat protein secretion system quality control protein TatD with DNase activity
MLTWTDTHAHFPADPAAAAAIVRRALAAGVSRILAVGGSPELNGAAIAAARAFPGCVRLALGLDRDQAVAEDPGLPDPGPRSPDPGPRSPDPGVRSPDPGVRSPDPGVRSPDSGDVPLAAIGETGLDYHYRPDTRTAQRDLFAAMLRLAGRRGLPAVIHTRDADADTLQILGEAGSPSLAAAGRLGVVHCFTGDAAFASALLDRGLYLGFSGIVTFRNADALRQVARLVPDDRLLIETDSPFLAPVPVRGRPNEPAFLGHVAACLARVRGVSAEWIADLTARNAERLFGPWSAGPADRIVRELGSD